MGKKKVISYLKENSYIDDRELYCYTNANMTNSKNYVLFMKLSFIKQNHLPGRMILSLCHDKLHMIISNMFGKPKKYFSTIDVSRMKYVNVFSKVLIESYQFAIDFEENQYLDFYIQGGHKKEKIRQVVSAIKASRNKR